MEQEVSRRSRSIHFVNCLCIKVKKHREQAIKQKGTIKTQKPKDKTMK